MVLSLRVVNDPAAAVVPPIAGGDAKYVLNPVPLTVEEADKVVNAPVLGLVPPIAGGDAKYVLNPVPLTVEEADKVVNAPVLGLVPPIAPGEAKVAPFKLEAFRLGTFVVEATVNGAVPVV
jgi:hypothetical protein